MTTLNQVVADAEQIHKHLKMPSHDALNITVIGTSFVEGRNLINRMLKESEVDVTCFVQYCNLQFLRMENLKEAQLLRGETRVHVYVTEEAGARFSNEVAVTAIDMLRNSLLMSATVLGKNIDDLFTFDDVPK